MAHELTQNAITGRYEMAYLASAGVPWHANETNPTAMADDASEAEWIEGAGMAWRIQRSKVRYFADAEGATQLEIPDQHVLMRSDTKAALGIVSAKYKVVQPAHTLQFFRDLIEDAGFKLTSAGTMFGGRKFWAQAAVGDNFEIGAGDKVQGYLLLATSADGSSGTEGKFVATRVVCNNTLTAAMGERGKHGTVKMSHRSTFNPNTMKDRLGIARDSFVTMAEQMRALASVKVSQADAADFVRKLLRPEEVTKVVANAAARIAETEGAQDFQSLLTRGAAPRIDVQDDKRRAPRGEADILRLFAGDARGSNLPGVRGTAWGLLNAVTEYVDHHATAKSASHRANSAWFNGGDDLKSDAFAQLLAMA